MAKIRLLNNSDRKKLLEMIEYVKPGVSPLSFNWQSFTIFPFNYIHNILPLSLKFSQESYVAVEDKDILGVIALTPDNIHRSRWQINRLILDNNSTEVGKQLVDFVVNKYGGAGVETFITAIGENYPEAIALFKNSCGFRSCSKMHIFEQKSSALNIDSASFENIRLACNADEPKIYELQQQILLPHFKPSFIRSVGDFGFGLKDSLLNKMKNYELKKYVLDNPKNSTIEGFFQIMTKDRKNYWLDIDLSLPYQDYYTDIIAFANKYIMRQTHEANMYIYLREYYQSSKKFTEVLKELNFSLKYTYQLLVKDYWKLLPAEKNKKMSVIIFPDITSPACNTFNSCE